MALPKWEKLSSEDKFKNRWWTYRLDKFRLPNGKEGEYHYLHSGHSVFIVPMLDDVRFLLVKQFRYLFDRESLEFPAGGMSDGDDPEDIARKELIEETGYDGDFTALGYFGPFVGLSDEKTFVFLATNLKRSDEFIKDETEQFEFEELTADEVDQKIASGEIFDGMAITSWVFAKNHLNK
ncbi:MAG: NUDIX hydrolase [Candidatus Uhrbacteria bacterium]|nr:NUDIX hydrolase [Patescibacteria group bacterium]MBU1663759.1 NUDIX hydrolase [Patescibacteria group bacterium]MBU1906811.1 NUDIX hydrolase [Patescibacteria group bacterium]